MRKSYNGVEEKKKTPSLGELLRKIIKLSRLCVRRHICGASVILYDLLEAPDGMGIRYPADDYTQNCSWKRFRPQIS